MIAAPLWAKESKKIERSVSLSSGYFTGSSNLVLSNSNRALSDFYTELGMAYGAGFDYFAETGWSHRNRGWFSLLNLVPNVLLAVGPIGTAYHEFGHFSRDKAYGYDPYFAGGGNKGSGGRANGFDHPIPYTLSRFIQPFSGGATGQGSQKWLSYALLDGVDSTTKQEVEAAFEKNGGFGVRWYIMTYKTNPEKKTLIENHYNEEIIISAAGVNNAMRLSDDLAQRVSEGQGHITEFFTYLGGRLQSAVYPSEKKEIKPGAHASNDMDSLVNFYTAKGLNIKKRDFDAANYRSFFLSATTYAYFLGWSNFVSRGQVGVPSPHYYGVRLPDTENYLLAEGLSHKVTSGYRVSQNLHFPVSVEWVYKGQKGCEVTLGVIKAFSSLSGLTVRGNVLFGRKLGGDIGIRQPIDRWFVEGVVESMHQKSYYGQRNIPSLKTSLRSLAVLVRAGWTY